MNLTTEEKILQRDLNRNPVFTGLCRKINEHHAIPKWKKTGDETEKHSDWIHKTGVKEGILFVLTHLGYNDDR